jgi:hypothetical protein
VCALSAKVARASGARNAKLHELQRELEAISEKLLPHLQVEEPVLFPAFLEASPSTGLFTNDVTFAMFEDHKTVADARARICLLADDFVVPEWGDGNYETLMGELAALEKDVHRPLPCCILGNRPGFLRRTHHCSTRRPPGGRHLSDQGRSFVQARRGPRFHKPSRQSTVASTALCRPPAAQAGFFGRDRFMRER